MTEGTAPGGGPLTPAARVTAFDRVRVAVHPGRNVVARVAGALLVAAVDGSDEENRALRAVLDLMGAGGQGEARAPGYRITRGLRELIASGAAPADLVLVAATDDGLAMVLTGAGTASVPERGWRLSCSDGQLLAREIDWPPAALLLDITNGGAGRDVAVREGQEGIRFDLRDGVVPGSAAVLASPPPGSAPPTETIQPAAGAAPVPAAAPVAAAAGGGGGATRVRGYRCRDGHLNDPRALFCAGCGIRMAESTAVLVEGPRPPLGLLVFDNGASVALDDNYLLGREPEADARVRTGGLRPLVLFDTGGVISRRHAEIRLEEWDVLLIDCGSANGTFVAERDAGQWSALVPGQPIRLLPSMSVRIGERSFVFEPLHGPP